MLLYSCGSQRGVSREESGDTSTASESIEVTEELRTPPEGNMAAGQRLERPPQSGTRPQGPPPGNFAGRAGNNDRGPGGPGGRPSGVPPQGVPGGMPMHEEFDASTIKAQLTLNEGEYTLEGKEITAFDENESAAAAFGDAVLNLHSNLLITSGNTSSQDMSSFQGLNAAVLARDNAQIHMSGNQISTTGLGANAIFAYGKGVIHSENDVINCTGDGGHGIMCSGGGKIYAKDIKITTSGKNSAPVATDRGSGVITVDGATIECSGQDSPGLYSTGQLIINNADILSTGAEAAVIEGSNSITLNDSKLVCTFANKWGIMIYQSFSGDAEGNNGEFTARNSQISVTDENSPLFFVTNASANIALQNNEITCASSVLLNAASSRWGHEGRNGGHAKLTALSQSLQGNLLADENSSIELNLTEGSTLTGAINPNSKAKEVKVSIDAHSRWELSEDSYVSVIDASIDNIVSNGHNIYYDAQKNPSLEGKSYELHGGGKLMAK